MNGRDLCQHVQVLGECFLSLHRCCDMCYRVYLRSRVCPCRRGLNACNRIPMSCVIYVCVCLCLCVCCHALMLRVITSGYLLIAGIAHS